MPQIIDDPNLPYMIHSKAIPAYLTEVIAAGVTDDKLMPVEILNSLVAAAPGKLGISPEDGATELPQYVRTSVTSCRQSSQCRRSGQSTSRRRQRPRTGVALGFGTVLLRSQGLAHTGGGAHAAKSSITTNTILRGAAALQRHAAFGTVGFQENALFVLGGEAPAFGLSHHLRIRWAFGSGPAGAGAGTCGGHQYEQEDWLKQADVQGRAIRRVRPTGAGNGDDAPVAAAQNSRPAKSIQS